MARPNDRHMQSVKAEVFVGEKKAKSWAVEHLNPAPSTPDELWDWPTALGLGCAGTVSECRRLMDNIVHGKVIDYGDYSGAEYTSEGLSVGSIGLARKLGVPSEVFQESITHVRSCDIGVLQKTILLEASQTLRLSESCVFSDLLDKLPAVGRAYLIEAKPDKNASPSDKELAYKGIEKWLYSNRSWLYTLDAKSTCFVHGEETCYAHPLGKSKVSETPIWAPFGSEPKQLNRTEQAIKYVDSRTGLRPLMMNTGTVSCVGWSSVGNKEKFGDESELPHAVWLIERIVRAEQGVEDCFFLECTEGYPVQVKLALLNKTHVVIFLRVGSENMGWPNKRYRTYAFGMVRGRLAWAGPEDYVRDFEEKFARAISLTGDDLLISPLKDVYAEYATLAAIQKNYMSADQIAEMCEDGCASMDVLRLIILTCGHKIVSFHP